MVESLNIQKVLAPISLTSRVKKAGRGKNKNRQRPLEEELKEKKDKKKGLSFDKQKIDEKTNIKKEESLKEKHTKETESMESKQGKVINVKTMEKVQKDVSADPYDEISKLASTGLGVQKISQKVGVPPGEVELYLKLNKNYPYN